MFFQFITQCSPRGFFPGLYVFHLYNKPKNIIPLLDHRKCLLNAL